MSKAGFTLHGASDPVPFFFFFFYPSEVAQIGTRTCKQEKSARIRKWSDRNQACFIYGNKSDLISASVSAAERLDIP